MSNRIKLLIMYSPIYWLISNYYMIWTIAQRTSIKCIAADSNSLEWAELGEYHHYHHAALQYLHITYSVKNIISLVIRSRYVIHAYIFTWVLMILEEPISLRICWYTAYNKEIIRYYHEWALNGSDSGAWRGLLIWVGSDMAAIHTQWQITFAPSAASRRVSWPTPHGLAGKTQQFKTISFVLYTILFIT